MIADIRRHDANDHPFRPDGDYVLYWMIAFRRPRFNHSLQHAVDRSIEFDKPLVIFEPLRTRYQWASDRIHAFVIEGMRSNAASFAKLPVTYFPYVEPRPGVGTPLLHQLAKNACTVVTDEYPCFFLPTMIDAVKNRIPARLELIDSNGVMPLRRPDRTFTVAHSYRRWVQKNIFDELADFPAANPVPNDLPRLENDSGATNRYEKIVKRWPAADLDALIDGDGLCEIPIDHSVRRSPILTGGADEADRRWQTFVDNKLSRYSDNRNHPDAVATTTMSSYLHFGHMSAFEMVDSIIDHENWTPDKAADPNGKQTGFWNMTVDAEALMEQILVWREIGFNRSFREPDQYDKLESLPDWTQKTMAQTASHERPHLYTLEQFERSQTHDDLWNAAQREIVQTGIMQNYMRMLWGKKILHWTESPQQALDFMVHLNNKYGLDGRDPNSFCGIFWVLGRYDRAWGPKREVFGSIRYMTSDSTRKKLKLSKYLERFGDRPGLFDQD